MTSKIVKSIKSNKWTQSKEYKTAHEFANSEEKKKYNKSYKKLNKWIEKNAGPNEYIGMNYKSGRKEVEKKVPKKFKKEVMYHETEELKKRKQLSK